MSLVWNVIEDDILVPEIPNLCDVVRGERNERSRVESGWGEGRYRKRSLRK